MLRDLDHKVLATLRELGIRQKTLAVAVSGGADSMALLNVLYKVAPLLECDVCAVHIHHGWKHGEQGKFRDSAWTHVKKYCDNKKSLVPDDRVRSLPFYSNLISLNPAKFAKEPEQTLHSEEELRDFRKACIIELLPEVQLKFGKPVVQAFAHHSEDLLETRLMRLIRGVGPEGLEAMNVFSGSTLRPFLNFSRDDIAAYLQQESVAFVRDPSNKDTAPLRNWLRKEWLPQLEAKRPGSVHRMALSLERVSEHNLEADKDLDLVTESGIPLESFLVLARDEKQQVLATYMRALRMKNYGTSHILEVLKRLDTPQKEHKFSLLKHQWEISGGRIKASPV